MWLIKFLFQAIEEEHLNNLYCFGYNQSQDTCKCKQELSWCTTWSPQISVNQTMLTSNWLFLTWGLEAVEYFKSTCKNLSEASYEYNFLSEKRLPNLINLKDKLSKDSCTSLMKKSVFVLAVLTQDVQAEVPLKDTCKMDFRVPWPPQAISSPQNLE